MKDMLLPTHAGDDPRDDLAVVRECIVREVIDGGEPAVPDRHIASRLAEVDRACDGCSFVALAKVGEELMLFDVADVEVTKTMSETFECTLLVVADLKRCLGQTPCSGAGVAFSALLHVDVDGAFRRDSSVNPLEDHEHDCYARHHESYCHQRTPRMQMDDLKTVLTLAGIP